MELTQEQLATLKLDIFANPAFNGWNFLTSAQEMAEWYNQKAVPDYYVWRTSVTSQEWKNQIIYYPGAAKQFDALSGAKRESLMWYLGDPNITLDMSFPEAREMINDWTGTQQTLKAALVVLEKRFATYIEKLFAVGDGTSNAPSTMDFEGEITYQQIDAALAMP